jgi:hypothetical protein
MKGGCLCGSVRYELTSPPQEAYYCHCRDCQYLSGSPFHVLGIVERESINLTSGEISEYTHEAQDGSGMKREFCTKCGTPLFVTSTRFQDIQMFTVNTLDEPDSITPSFEIWTSSKVTWANIQLNNNSFKHGALDEPSD